MSTSAAMATVIWFTGLSGSGKSTLAEALKKELEARGKTVVLIDGDDVRGTLHTHLGFTAEDITENNRLIAMLAKESMAQADVVLVPIISPLRASRTDARKVIGHGFLELYVDSSDETRRARDPKGLYARVVAGEMPDFIGYGGVPYEEPEHPDLTIRTDHQSVSESVAEIVRYLDTYTERPNTVDT